MSNFYIEYKTSSGTQYQEFATGALLRQFILDNKTTFINHCKVVAKLPEITSCYALFQNCSATSIDLSDFDTSNVTNMSNMFWGSQATNLDLSSFDTSKVTNMGAMFRGAKIISLDLRHFDTSNVTTMNHMFMQTSLTELDVSGWNTIKVTNMQSMFYNSPITALDVSSFDTSKVTNFSFMFNGTQVIELDVSNFNLSSATLLNVMFSNCSKLKTIYCEEDWNSYTGITNSDNMFHGCTSLVGAIPYNSTKTDIIYANPTTGYFTVKEQPEPTVLGKILFNTNEFKKIMFENKEYVKIMFNDLLIWSKGGTQPIPHNLEVTQVLNNGGDPANVSARPRIRIETPDGLKQNGITLCWSRSENQPPKENFDYVMNVDEGLITYTFYVPRINLVLSDDFYGIYYLWVRFEDVNGGVLYWRSNLYNFVE